MGKPNIFNYATSELSQDAIICYILEWAKVENKKHNKNLHQLGIDFLDSLFNKFKNIKKPKNYNQIRIEKQYKNIDVLCIINEEYALIIEDKTNTKNHSNQLEKYLEEIEKSYSKDKILPIYFKTGDQSNYDDVMNNGYEIYLRRDFLIVLNSVEFQNDILEDYSDFLRNIESEIKSYQTLPIDQWYWHSWKGFYIALKKRLNEGNWDYVSNRSGGFLGFWWNWDSDSDYHIYLQIDHTMRKITFKLYSKTDDKVDKDIVNNWKRHIIYNEKNIIIKKPKVVRTGKSVTIGILETEFRVTDDKNIIDMDKTVDFIKKIEEIKRNKLRSL